MNQIETIFYELDRDIRNSKSWQDRFERQLRKLCEYTDDKNDQMIKATWLELKLTWDMLAHIHHLYRENQKPCMKTIYDALDRMKLDEYGNQI